MSRVVCGTCGVSTWSDKHPCVNCDACPPVSTWSGSFQFDQALRGMRLGKRVRRSCWDRSWGIEGGTLKVFWPVPDGGADEGALAYELHEHDVLADDWEVVP